MSQIEPSVDELMWLLAEQNEAAATESFGKRYPQYRDELHKRIRLVNGIRATKPVAAVSAASPPPFDARPVRPNTTPIWTVAGLVAMFTITYGVSRVAFAPPTPTPAEVQVNNPVTYLKTPQTATPGPDETFRQNLNSGATAGQTEPATAPAATPPPSPMERRITVESGESTLVQVLNKISLQSGVQFQLAPGVTDMPLTLGFQDRSVAEALTEIAIALNISFLEQDPGNVLIIPAGNQGPITTNTGG